MGNFSVAARSIRVIIVYGISYKNAASVWLKQNKNKRRFDELEYWTCGNSEISLFAMEKAEEWSVGE